MRKPPLLLHKVPRSLYVYIKNSKGLTRPKSKFITQMIYGILVVYKVQPNEIAHFLNEIIPLKKTVWSLRLLL